MTATTLPRSRPVGEPAIPTRVWSALARREAGATLRHPLVWIGVLASGYVLWSFNRGELPHLGGYSTYVGLGLVPLAGAALLVAHLQTSRAHRHGTLEIEDPAPAQRRARTLGHLVGSLAVVPAAAVVVAAYMVYLYWLGGTGRPDIGELLAGPIVVGVAAVAGVAAGTWFPNRFSGLMGLGALAAVQIALHDAPGTLHWFAWWHTVLWHGGFDLWIRPGWAHLIYLVGVALFVGASASLRHGIRVAPVAMAMTGVALVLTGGVMQAQPPSEVEVDRRFDQIANPATHWVTTERDGITFSVHPGYERWIDWWDAVIADTVAPIEAADRPTLVVEQWNHAFPSQLLDEFGESDPTWATLTRRATEHFFVSRPTDPWPIRVGDTLRLDEEPALVIAVAQRSVGLPLVPVEIEGPLFTEDEIAVFNRQPADPTESIHWPGRERGLPPPVLGDRWTYEVACHAEGQAREVVAAWLAAQASPDLADRYRAIRRSGPAVSARDGEGFTEYWPGGSGSPTPAVHWDLLGWVLRSGANGADAVLGSPTATDLAAQLLERPHADVAAAINEHWDEWTHPATPIQGIIDAFDLEAPPTPEQWIERGGKDPADYAASIAAYPRWLGDDLLSDQLYPTCP